MPKNHIPSPTYPIGTPQKLLSQLTEIEHVIEAYCKIYVENTGSYEHNFTRFHKPLRDGIVFYRVKSGWRLCKNWQETLNTKRRELLEQIDAE